MKIDISTLDNTQFLIHKHLLFDETIYLIQPNHIGIKFNQNNKHFRSSVWNEHGELISASFPKFVNFGENSENFPIPASLKGTTIVEKIDGSTLIISKYKGNFIIRTRGTVDATKIDNGHEISILMEKYPKIKQYCSDLDTWDFSLLFEWVTPLNKIILSYGNEVDLYFIGGVHHSTYSMMLQYVVDDLAKQFNVKRPSTYTFNTIQDLIENVDKWQDKEGIVLYSKDDQMLHKIKAFEYLKLHRFKSEASFENTVELFFSYNMPSYQEFEKQLIEQFDYECFSMVRGFISTIIDGWKEVQLIMQHMQNFIEPLKSVTRKEAALKIVGAYSTTNRGGFCFQLLDGKSLDKEAYKKLLYQVTKA